MIGPLLLRNSNSSCAISSFFFFKHKTEFLARQNCNFGWGGANGH